MMALYINILSIKYGKINLKKFANALITSRYRLYDIGPIMLVYISEKVSDLNSNR